MGTRRSITKLRGVPFSNIVEMLTLAAGNACRVRKWAAGGVCCAFKGKDALAQSRITSEDWAILASGPDFRILVKGFNSRPAKTY
jgi:hypothetical protein